MSDSQGSLKADLTSLGQNLTKLSKDLTDKIDLTGKGTGKVETGLLEVQDNLKKFRAEFLNLLGNIGGGAMNRQNFIGGVDPLTKYTDINWKAGAGTTLTYANNDTTKKVDITITGSAGSGITRQIQTTTISSVMAGLSGVDQVTLANGGVAITLPTAISDTSLYTIKNIGVSSVLVATTGGETIDGNANIIMPIQYTSVDLISDGSNWGIT